MAGEIEGHGWEGGGGGGGGEVDSPKIVLRCLAAREERGRRQGGVDRDSGVGEGAVAVGADEGRDGEQVVVKVGVGTYKAGDRKSMERESEGPAGCGTKHGTVGEVEGGGGDIARGEERGEEREGGSPKKDVRRTGVGGCGVRHSGDKRVCVTRR